MKRKSFFALFQIQQTTNLRKGDVIFLLKPRVTLAAHKLPSKANRAVNNNHFLFIKAALDSPRNNKLQVNSSQELWKHFNHPESVLMLFLWRGIINSFEELQPSFWFLGLLPELSWRQKNSLSIINAILPGEIRHSRYLNAICSEIPSPFFILAP